MILSIHQPAYLPWLGYFERIARSDRHVVLDHVQFEKNSFINRNRIRTPAGVTWLTVPVRTKGRFGALPIRDLEIDNTQHWADKHWKSISQSYARAPFFDRHAEFLRGVYARRWSRLAELCRVLREYILAELRIDTPCVESAALAVAGRKDDLVREICVSLGADAYLSGALGRDYLRVDRFTEAGVAVVFQDYQHPAYPQVGHGDFEPNLSVLDLLMNCGPAARDILFSSPSPFAPQEALR